VDKKRKIRVFSFRQARNSRNGKFRHSTSVFRVQMIWRVSALVVVGAIEILVQINVLVDQKGRKAHFIENDRIGVEVVAQIAPSTAERWNQRRLDTKQKTRRQGQ